MPIYKFPWEVKAWNCWTRTLFPICILTRSISKKFPKQILFSRIRVRKNYAITRNTFASYLPPCKSVVTEILAKIKFQPYVKPPFIRAKVLGESFFANVSPVACLAKVFMLFFVFFFQSYNFRFISFSFTFTSHFISSSLCHCEKVRVHLCSLEDKS